jgi:hypothetical protein
MHYIGRISFVSGKEVDAVEGTPLLAICRNMSL